MCRRPHECSAALAKDRHRKPNQQHDERLDRAMKSFAAYLVLLMSFALASPAGVLAKEYNKRTHLDPGSQAKVNAVIAIGLKDRPFGADTSGGTTNSGCGGLKVGNLDNSGRPPREVIIVARDIINVSKNC